jgi:LPS export ABC transporter protein LptC
VIGKLVAGLLVVLLIAGSWFLSRGTGRGTEPRIEAPMEEPGYFARDAEVIETGEDGRPLYTLSADRIRQAANDSRVQLENPRMRFVASDGNTWHVSAQSGIIREDASQIELSGDVRVTGRLPNRNDPIEVQTSVLAFDARTEVLSTDAPVLFGSGARKLSGVGLVAKLPEHRFRLERVNGSFPAR